MRPIPRDDSFDSTLALLRDPYRYVARRCPTLGTDLFATRLLLQPAICMSGADTARLFYDDERFTRTDAAPLRLRKTLFGTGGVQSLDGHRHRARKRMFMSLMTSERVGALVLRTGELLRAAAHRWSAQRQVVLYPALLPVLTRAACEWTGIPIEEAELDARTRDITALFDYAGRVGPQHWRARWARRRSEQWITVIVRNIRAARVEPSTQSPAHTIAWHMDPDLRLLEPRIAAVELLNLVRPTVAVAVYITFVAHALHRHPDCRERLQSGDEDYASAFVQEVRRAYPFFPLVVARVRRDFEWNGYAFPRGRRVVLDLFGTNHDARVWDDPYVFRPERFLGWNGDPYAFVPQGGGDHQRNHRCPGEWITLELMKLAATFFACDIDYEVPEQDLDIDYSRLPALPRSGFVMANTALRLNIPD